MKVHFEGPYFSEYTEKHICGTEVSEFSDDLDISNDWSKVTCKRCLKNKESINKFIKSTEEEINKQYGDMADFFSKEDKRNKQEEA